MANGVTLLCPECDFTSSKEKRLVKHLRKSHGKAAVKCPWCIDVHYSSSPAGLCVHKKHDHRSIRLRCFLCEYSSRSLTRWASHVTLNHSGQASSLVILNRVAADQGQIYRDVKNKALTSESSMQEACLQLTPEKDVLVHTDKTTPKDTDAILNSKTYHKALTLTSSFSCSLCKYTTSKYKKLRKHVEQEHSDSTSKGTDNSCVPCPYCSSSFASTRLVADHCKSQHLQGPPYQCIQCEYHCKYIAQMITHQYGHNGLKPFACPVCPHKTANKHALKRHMKTHTGEKPFACKVCSYRCAEKAYLQRHMRTHTGERPFACEFCSYKAADKSSLLRHKNVHTGHAPFACHLCPYRASLREHLTSHIRTHTNERPYKCPVCDYSGKQLMHVRIHMKTHTKEKPYQCKMCRRKFSYSSSLNAHMKNAICSAGSAVGFR
ncbi:Zinc finger protein 845 [Plakobranchus ocellatus]|uniref:Zinc finger protein 845 n=1 Tax=Plakobranchus ocellatus TaxID=259542 RepID=A0AAV4C4E4_9GAST|nr:Zinc finger protein 845 [Plakobranchus ocellatus]